MAKNTKKSAEIATEIQLEPTLYIVDGDDFEREYESKRGDKKKNLWLTLLFIVLNTAAIAFVVVSEQMSGSAIATFDMALVAISENIGFFIASLMIYVIVMLIDTVGYSSVIKLVTGKHQIGAGFRVGAMGRYYDYITPLATGGQPFQIYTLLKSGLTASEASSVTIGRYVIKQFTWCLFIAIMLILAPVLCPAFTMDSFEATTAIIGLAIWMSVPLFITFVSVNRKVGLNIVIGVVKILYKLKIVKNFSKALSATVSKVNSYRASMSEIVSNKKEMFRQIALVIIEGVLTFSIPFFAFKTFGGTTYADFSTLDTWMSMAFAFMYAQCAVSFIPTPGTSGAAEISFKAVFSTYFAGIAGGNMMFWGMLLWRFLTYYMFIIMGLIVMFVDAINKWIKKKR